jgi:hypothetical protein
MSTTLAPSPCEEQVETATGDESHRPQMTPQPPPAADSHRHQHNSAPLIISSSNCTDDTITPVHHTHDSDTTHKTLPQEPQAAHLKPATSGSTPRTSSTDSIHECCAIRAPAPRTETPAKMGLSKTQRICILLAIDSCFFLVELICGTSAHLEEKIVGRD